MDAETIRLNRNASARRSYVRRAILVRERKLKAVYGLGLKEYDSLLAAQDGVCKICENSETRVNRGKVIQLSVDHDHITGHIRGLLCHKCNVAIGFFGESSDLIRQAADYVEKDGDISG